MYTQYGDVLSMPLSQHALLKAHRRLTQPCLCQCVINLNTSVRLGALFESRYTIEVCIEDKNCCVFNGVFIALQGSCTRVLDTVLLVLPQWDPLIRSSLTVNPSYKEAKNLDPSSPRQRQTGKLTLH